MVTIVKKKVYRVRILSLQSSDEIMKTGILNLKETIIHFSSEMVQNIFFNMYPKFHDDRMDQLFCTSF